MKERIVDETLVDAVLRAERGLVDADLGGGVIKQRIARHGEGKSGGYRSIILYRTRDRAIFVYGFPKSARENITRDELVAFKELAKTMLMYTDEQLGVAVLTEKLVEVKNDEQDL